MRTTSFFITALVIFLFFSCTSKPDVSESVSGNWLILYPDHHLKTNNERDVYGRHQDSIVNLFGLKLISITADGRFTEADSMFKAPASWALSNKNDFHIREGGKGFNPFNASFEAFENDTLRLVQKLPLENEKINVVWHLKNVDDDTIAKKLLSPGANKWRTRSLTPESESAIQQRLVSLLNYYSDYFKLISQESSYFLVPRVHLPFRYYQHAIGMKDEMPAGFISLFYNEDDARKGYQILQTTLLRLANNFEPGENFVVEYGLFFKRMAVRIQNNATGMY